MTWRRAPRKPEPRIVDPTTHPGPVNFTVAAEFLGISRHDVMAYVDEGELTAIWVGRRRRIQPAELARFKKWREQHLASL